MIAASIKSLASFDMHPEFKENLPTDERELLVSISKMSLIKTGENINSSSLIIPFSGKLQIRDFESNRHLAFISPGSVCGDPVMKRTSISAISDTFIFKINDLVLLSHKNRLPIFYEWLNNESPKIKEMSIKTLLYDVNHGILERIANHLLNFELYEIQIIHSQIADSIGTRRETVSEIMSKLTNFGCIRCSRGRLFIEDRKSLSEIAFKESD
jgi:hypothetical protein